MAQDKIYTPLQIKYFSMKIRFLARSAVEEKVRKLDLKKKNQKTQPHTGSLQAEGGKVQMLVSKLHSSLGTKINSPALAPALYCVYKHHFQVKSD